ncbi:MAG: radical SAM family heme chaperone HemW [Longilinea sp.]|nr:radical SAM family heme chaperone HemW [Longilinea sp.]MCA1954232.1 radical SAM family heme chaperone HemW [Anaerolinea sp.]
MDYSLYLHIPFCRRRCGYCDFNTYAGREALLVPYVQGVLSELRLVAAAAGQPLSVGTIYFGGGTPSLLAATQVQQLLEEIAALFQVRANAEVTLEANPGTLTRAALAGLRTAGVNRLSLGMQAGHVQELRTLDRWHTTAQVFEAVHQAQQVGFERLSLDLIYGIPGQTLTRWQETIEMALEMGVEHLSLYSLTVEQGTPLARWVGRGLLPQPDEDLAADMAEWAAQRLEQAGFEQYEISNWARRDAQGCLRSSQHNLQYWHNDPYLGFGAGAHGWAAGFRTANEPTIEAYLSRLTAGPSEAFPFSPANVTRLKIDRQTEMQETMMVGLRLMQEGVAEQRFVQRFGVSMLDVFAEPIERLTRQGLLEWVSIQGQSRLRLTRRAWLIGNRVFAEFVG